MEQELQPHRCPKCNALVVDRRSPACTNCHGELPPEWIMSREQIANVTKADAHARAEFDSSMNDLDKIVTETDPTV